MKLVFLLIIFCASITQLAAQTKVPRMQKYPIGNTGLSLYLPAKPTVATTTYSPDSAKITTMECLDTSQNNQFHFGCIVAQMKDVNLKGQEEDMLISYLDYLKSAVEVKSSAGYGKGHTLESHPGVKGVIDYWEDNNGDQWKITAWADEHNIVVLYINGKGDYPIYNITEMFAKGIRFAGDK